MALCFGSVEQMITCVLALHCTYQCDLKVINGLYAIGSSEDYQGRGLNHTAIVHVIARTLPYPSIIMKHNSIPVISQIPGGTGNGLSLSLGCAGALDALMNVFNGRCKSSNGRGVDEYGCSRQYRCC